jgi:CPA1 family monovalent cation:H+ antiporter
MHLVHFFELALAAFFVIIVLHYVAHRIGLPAPVALLVGGAALAFLPGLPTISVDPEFVLVIFLPPLLFDSAWSVAVGQLLRHRIGIASLAVGAVLFTTVAVAFTTHLLMPALPMAVCAALGAIVSPPDAISARAVLAKVKLPRRIKILLEGESLLNDASGLVLFRFAVAAAVGGTFDAVEAVGQFFVLAVGGAIVGGILGMAWVKLVRKLGDEYLIIATTTLMSWASYLLAETLHVSGVIATVTTGIVASWHAHTVLAASTRVRGGSFWTVVVFLMEASVFVLIGLSLRGVVERVGGFGVLVTSMGLPALVVLVVLIVSRFVWMFGSDLVIAAAHAGGVRFTPLGPRASTVLSWAGVRGVVTLALALSIPEALPGRDFILVTGFVVILGTVLIQATTFERLIAWAKLRESPSDVAALTLSKAESAMAQAQVVVVRKGAYDPEGKLIHPKLLAQFEKRAETIVDYANRPEHYAPDLHAHFDLVLVAIAAARVELVRLHRAGDIDDETLHELERDLDLQELTALSAKS